MRAAVAHGDKDIPLLELDDGLIDPFAADAHFGFGVIVVLVLAQHDDAGVIILDDLHPLVIDQVHDGEGGIRHPAHRAHGQRGRDGGYAVLQTQALGHHGGDDLAGQRGQDAGLYAAAQAVGQHDDGGVIALLHNIHMVAAQLLAIVVDAFIADIRAKIIHQK